MFNFILAIIGTLIYGYLQHFEGNMLEGFIVLVGTFTVLNIMDIRDYLKIIRDKGGF